MKKLILKEVSGKAIAGLGATLGGYMVGGAIADKALDPATKKAVNKRIDAHLAKKRKKQVKEAASKSLGKIISGGVLGGIAYGALDKGAQVAKAGKNYELYQKRKADRERREVKESVKERITKKLTPDNIQKAKNYAVASGSGIVFGAVKDSGTDALKGEIDKAKEVGQKAYIKRQKKQRRAARYNKVKTTILGENIMTTEQLESMREFIASMVFTEAPFRPIGKFISKAADPKRAKKARSALAAMGDITKKAPSKFPKTLNLK
jgi:hypothetical protein